MVEQVAVEHSDKFNVADSFVFNEANRLLSIHTGEGDSFRRVVRRQIPQMYVLIFDRSTASHLSCAAVRAASRTSCELFSLTLSLSARESSHSLWRNIQ